MADELLTALENERRYVARELHDGVAQTTQQLSLQAGLCQKMLAADRLDMLTEELARLEERAQQAATQVRELIADMRPPEIEPAADFAEALQQVINQHLARGGPPVELRFEWKTPLPFDIGQPRLALLRICHEALFNIRKHAEAAQVHLTFTTDDDQFYLTIADNGRGFDPLETAARSVDKGGAGLANMQARAKALGGSCAVGRNILGAGTKVTVMLPRSS